MKLVVSLFLFYLRCLIQSDAVHILKEHPETRTLIYYQDGTIESYSFEEWASIMSAPFSVPMDQDFIDNVPSLIDELGKQLKIAPKHLNGTLESLEKIDRVIQRLDRRGELNEGKIFHPLLAYSGQVVINATQGSWHLYLNEYGKAVIGVKTPEGKVIELYHILDKLLVKGGKIFVSAAIEFAINHIGLPLANPSSGIPLNQIYLT